jgi:acetyltransferase-like isoleucine patch superfamily enzyme
VRTFTKRRPSEDPLQLLPRVLTKMYSSWIRLTYPFASIGRGVSFHFTSKISRSRASRMSLGNSMSLRQYAWLSVATEEPAGDPVIVIEDNCHIGFGSIISAKNRIHLERDVLVGQYVLIVDHNHAYEDISLPIVKQSVTEGGRIRIGQGSWIGQGVSIVCPRGELSIGRNCVIAANSVVMESIPDFCVAAGFPTKIIRQYDATKQAWRIGRASSRGSHTPEKLAEALSQRG